VGHAAVLVEGVVLEGTALEAAVRQIR